MKIIKDLAQASVKNSKKDTLAIKVSIFLAVVILGTIVFIIGSLKRDEYKYMSSTVGDYHVQLSQVDENIYDTLKSKEEIEKISFDEFIPTDLGADIYKVEDFEKIFAKYELLRGRKPSKPDELIVPEKFLKNNKSYSLGSKISVDDMTYTIVGIYDINDFSFEDSILLGILEKPSKKELFDSKGGIGAFIWYKNPRDTYTETRNLLKKLSIDEEKSLSTGRLYYNLPILEYKMVYPKGLIPPKSVIGEAVEKYGALFFLSLLFASMIYGAFNVWNNRELKEIALLKSVGMTEKQVKKMVRLKALKLALVPIFLGLFVSYLTANLLLYLMWLNNTKTYENLGNILAEKMTGPDFHIVYPSPVSILIIIIFALLTVYVSAIVPARRSGRLNIIEGLNEISEKNLSLGKSEINGEIEKTLAKDYFKAYKSTYKVINLSMVLSALAITSLLVTQSHKDLVSKYDSYDSPYNFTSNIYSEEDLNEDMVEEINEIGGIDQIHIYQNKDFKFFLDDNKDFISHDLKGALTMGKKDPERLYARICALSDEDFENILKKNNKSLDTSFLLLNKIGEDDNSPYSFTDYIPINDNLDRDLILRYSAEADPIKVHIDGHRNHAL